MSYKRVIFRAKPTAQHAEHALHYELMMHTNQSAYLLRSKIDCSSPVIPEGTALRKTVCGGELAKT